MKKELGIRTVADVVAKWDGHPYKYGPLKEETS